MKEVSALNIKKLVFKNFKTLEEVSFEPGRVNVLLEQMALEKQQSLRLLVALCCYDRSSR